MSPQQQVLLFWRREFGENIRMAFDTLRTNKLRSILTMLGVIIAVITLVLVVAILMGFDQNVKESVRSFGTNTAFFWHRSTGPRFGRLSKEERTRKPFTYEDFRAVKEACTACVKATVSVFPKGGPSRARYKGEEVIGLDYRGATEEFFSVYANAVVKEGRAFTAAENLHRIEIAVIGEDLAKGLFGTLSPLDKEITVSGHNFRVIGVFEKPASGGGGPGGGADNRVVVPYWTFTKMHHGLLNQGIRIEAAEGLLPEAIDQTRIALRLSRRVPIGKPDNFDYTTAEATIQQFHDIVGVVALVTSVISSVGLMIGGVGVMNIMLVSVTERTREIGVRKAIGARRRDIVWQFLTEAMILTGVGGIIGVMVSWGLSTLIRTTVPSLPTFIPVWVVVLAVSVSASIGLFFGIYPAVKAARLDPVDALRYE